MIQRKLITLFAIMTLSAIVLLPAAQMSAQDHSADRKVLTRVAPNYPELARRMHIRGVVKLEITVRPDGDVKSTRVVGGNPVLIQAAVDAVAKWKFEVSPNETTEVLQLTFQQ